MNDLYPVSDEYNAEESNRGEENEEEDYLMNLESPLEEQEEEVNDLEYEGQNSDVDLDEFYEQINAQYPDEEFEKAQLTVADYLEHQQELEEDGWAQIYTLNDEIVLLARRR